MKKFLTAKNILTAIPLMLSLGMLVAAEIIRQLPGKNELIYYKGVSSEFYANASVGAAACFGALFLLVLRMRTAKRAAALLMTLLCTIAVTGSALLIISILADKHRYYMYNNMYNYGSHRILHAKDGEDFVLYQQSGRYTFKEFCRSDTAIDPTDIVWGDNAFGVIVGEDTSDPENITPITEWFDYSAYNA